MNARERDDLARFITRVIVYGSFALLVIMCLASCATIEGSNEHLSIETCVWWER